jgi:thiamine-monophosphate kinase
MGPGAEFDLVRAIVARLGTNASGVGSDCAAIRLPSGATLLTSVDMTVEGVHFRPDWLSPREIGYRAAMSAWSDLAPSGGTPIGAMLAIAVPAHWASKVVDIAEGVGEASRIAGAPIVGGDTTNSATLVISISVFGAATRPVDRSGARIGDHVYVTGTLGGPGAAVRSWTRGEPVDAATRERFARPKARLDEGRWLATRGVSAAIDVSDGLIGDLQHVAAASSARLIIDLDRVPRWPGTTPMEAASSGEEYEVAFTTPGAIDTTAFAQEFGIPVTQIGRVAAGSPEVEAHLNGVRVDPPSGYDHFSR